MLKGSFRTDTFNEENPTINMRNWVEPTAYNNGESTVIINGMKLRPCGVLSLGAAGVRMNGAVQIMFPETGNHDIKVSYVLLQENCLTTP